MLLGVVRGFELLRVRPELVPDSPTARLAFNFKWWCLEPALQALVVEPATAERARREFTAESRFAADTTFRAGQTRRKLNQIFDGSKERGARRPRARRGR